MTTNDPRDPDVATGAQEAAEPPICSARGCRAESVWGLRWNNPRLHTPGRRKVWLACDEHRGHLEHFLGSRGFLRETVAVGELGEDDG